MGPAQCLPTEWPGSASVRPGGTGPDVALSLSRAVTIRLIMIEVRMFSIVHSLFFNDSESACILTHNFHIILILEACNTLIIGIPFLAKSQL